MQSKHPSDLTAPHGPVRPSGVRHKLVALSLLLGLVLYLDRAAISVPAPAIRQVCVPETP